MYLELSRPNGDITRWEKVLKRLNLLNKNYPLKAANCDPDSFAKSLSGRSYNKQYFHEKTKYRMLLKMLRRRQLRNSFLSVDTHFHFIRDTWKTNNVNIWLKTLFWYVVYFPRQNRKTN